MPWTTITPADLQTAKAAALVDQLHSAALGVGQADPIPEIIANVTARLRCEIASGGKTRLDQDTTLIPGSLKSLAVRMVLREAQSRLNAAAALPLSEDEREEARQDIRYLERIASGEVTVEVAATPEPSASVQAAVPSPRISSRTLRFDRRSTEGV
jgi:hypothetical protein